MADDKAIQELLDKDEIREVVGVRYGLAMDWYDLDLLKACFHPDAVVDYGYFKGNAHQWCESRIAAEAPDVLGRFHYCFPPSIEIQGALAYANSTSLAGIRRDEHNVFFGARYSDTLERRDGYWRIAERIVQLDFTQSLPASAAPGMQQALRFLTHPSPEHPLYKRFHRR